MHGADVNGQRVMQNSVNSTDSGQQGFQTQQETQVRSAATLFCSVISHVPHPQHVTHRQSQSYIFIYVDAITDAECASTPDDADSQRYATRSTGIG